MMEHGEIQGSDEYRSFRATVPKRKVIVQHLGKDYTWSMYDHGPRTDKEPILFFPPVSSRSDVFFRQLLDLGSVGFRCIAVDYPIVWTVDEFCAVMSLLLDHLDITSVHIMGGSLGAYLAQKFAEFTYKTPIVKSIMLVNGFTDTAVFKNAPSPLVIPFIPGFMLKRLLIQNMPSSKLHPDVADSIDFVIEDLQSLTQTELASRLTLNVKHSYVEPQNLFKQDIQVMIIEVNDKSALSTAVKNEMRKYYTDAKLCLLKYGGNFPYLANSLEVNMFIKIHMRRFKPKEKESNDSEEKSEEEDGENEEEDVTF
eukprot:m.34527 g.34527  ORF g.34527 m.34527 type:complete len:311 (+) comp6537_c0_seq1:66-998(+)